MSILNLVKRLYSNVPKKINKEGMFRNAEFGDRFKTRDGRLAIFVGCSRNEFYVKGLKNESQFAYHYYTDDSGLYYYVNDMTKEKHYIPERDIIGRYGLIGKIKDIIYDIRRIF